eukprot:TRINITY_DN6546_c0_g1_i1.p1 TRINITY_DN6546_c0_g1~~TRINITY_DN6546_c0_g1_i1.p1  ORF type:complete len:196 (-),score=15.91 TRINITY_DN6546_c0_g1_i1:108-644(-)
MPVQRVPRYELLLREVIRYTEPTHVDYNNLVQAQDAIQAVNSYINKRKKDIDSRQKLTTIQKVVKNCPSLVVAHRYYLREGYLQASSTDKSKSGMFYYFLFNDSMMACKKQGGFFHSHEWEYYHTIPLSEATVKRVSTDPTMFRILLGKIEDLNVTFFLLSVAAMLKKQRSGLKVSKK